MDIDELKKPFPIDKIRWRVGATNKDKTQGIALAYIDARDLYERLDEVCGVYGWQMNITCSDGKTLASLGIKINDEWIWKTNGAGDTQVEGDKGAISDAHKRAGVLWGIGRYLYDVPNTWVELDSYRRIKNPNDPKLEGALKKAMALHGTQDMKKIKAEKAQDVDEKRQLAAAWSAQKVTELHTMGDAPTLRAWLISMEKELKRLENYPDLHEGFMNAYEDRLNSVK